jgi:Fe-S cluster assembly protein SufD
MIRAVLIAAALAGPAAAADVPTPQGAWELVRINGQRTPIPATLTLEKDRVSGRAFCNGFDGGYRIRSGRLLARQVSATKLRCDRQERIVRLDEPADAVSISTSAVRLSAGSAFRQTVLASGARLQRHETHVRHPGQGATAEVNGAYVLRAQRHFDLTTTVTHEGEGGMTRQLTKGVVADEARGVFQGRITVLAGADRTDARMGHHALVLSDRAEVDAKPELEIWADDVQCAHGNTVGSLDENALFYARSRGMTEAQARALLTEAFLGQAVDGIVHEAAQERARAWIAERLGA